MADPNTQGEGSRALAFFHALLLAGVVLAPMGADSDLKRVLALAWVGTGLLAVALWPKAHLRAPRALVLALAGYLGAWGLAWAATPVKLAGLGRMENQLFFVLAAYVAAVLSGPSRRLQGTAWVAAAVVVCAYALGTQSGRHQGTFGNPLYFGGFLLLTLALPWGLWQTGKILIVAALLFIVAAFSTGSRGVALSLGLVLLPALTLESRRLSLANLGKRGWTALAILATGIVLSAALELDWRRPTLRLPLWQATLRQALDHLWLGAGPGSFALAFHATPGTMLEQALNAGNQYAEHPHNWVLFQFFEGGLLVLGAFGLLLLNFVRGLRPRLAQGASSSLSLCAGAGALAFLFENFFDRTLEVPGVAFFFWLCLGWASSSGDEERLNLGRWARLALALLAAGVLALGLRPLYQARAVEKESATLAPVSGLERELQARVLAHPRDALAWEVWGSHLASQRRYADSRQAYQKALELDPKSRSAALNLGNAHFMLGDMAAAEAAYRKAVALDGGYAEARFDLGACLFYQRRLKEAVAQLDLALQLDPSHARAKALKAQILQ